MDKERARARYREIELPGGWCVLVGRQDADNDYLSLKVAKPTDWWFHVRGAPGSHVVLRSKPDESPDRDILRQAAAIAAYFSRARRGGVVAVSCTQACNVSKRRGAKPGSVSVRKETVLKVRPSPDGTLEP